MEKKQIPIIVVAGPTASGKTALGVEICKRFNGEVVSADSMQIYEHLDIGTAKPSVEEMQGIPHHLMGFQSPGVEFSVADYVAKAHEIIGDITKRGKLPVIVGGTGLYIQSLVDNITFAETQTDPQLRQRLAEFAEQKGNQALWERLNQVDPELAATLHPNNRGRVIRAIEVWETTGITMSEQKKRSRVNPSPYLPCMIGLNFRDRQLLYDRINLRVNLMVKNGLLEEAKWLFQQDYGKTAKQAIGYKELESYLAEKESLEEAVQRIQQESRRYAKRQITWFGRDSRFHWFYLDDYPAATFAKTNTKTGIPSYDTDSLIEDVLKTIADFQKNLEFVQSFSSN